MLKYGLAFFLFIININTVHAQYLKFGELLKILELSDDKFETQKFMKLNGFELTNLEYFDQENEEDFLSVSLEVEKLNNPVKQVYQRFSAQYPS